MNDVEQQNGATSNRQMTITVVCTEERAAESGVATVKRTYVGSHLKFIECLEDLLEISGLTGADVARVDLS